MLVLVCIYFLYVFLCSFGGVVAFRSVEESIFVIGLLSSMSLRVCCRYSSRYTSERIALDLAALIYGICPFFVIQTPWNAGIVFILFPILVLLLHRSASGNRKACLTTVFIFAVAYLADPKDMIPTSVAIMLIVLGEGIVTGGEVTIPFLRSLGIVLCSALISSFRIIPVLCEQRSLQRQVSGVFLYHYMPMVISVSLIWLTVCFFLSPSGAKKKAVAFFLMLIFFSGASMDAVGTFFSLGVYRNGETTAYRIALCFVLLSVAVKAASGLQKTDKIKSIGAGLIAIVIAGFLFILMRVFVSGPVLLSAIISLALLLIFPILLFLDEKYKKVVLTLAVTVDVLLSMFAFTGQVYYADSANLLREVRHSFEGCGILKQTQEEDKQISFDLIYEGMIDTSAYEAFYAAHSAKDLEDMVSYLDAYVPGDSVIYQNEFERINEKCRALGCEKSLFRPLSGYEIGFDENVFCTVHEEYEGIYNIEFDAARKDKSAVYIYVPFFIKADRVPGNPIYLYDSYSQTFICYTPEQLRKTETSYLAFLQQDHFDVNFMFSAYEMDSEVYDLVGDLLIERAEAQRTGRQVIATVIGWIVSAWTLFFLGRYVWKRNPEWDGVGGKIKQIIPVAAGFVRSNVIYFISFSGPFFAFLMLLLVNGCMPFGSKSIFDQDGTQLYLPMIFEGINAADTESFLLSISGGYGYGLFYVNGFGRLYSLLRGLSATNVIGLLSVAEAISVGLCGVTMVYYMTHSHTFTGVSKRDYKLLIPAFSYALSSYMIAIHMYPTWYLNVILFPLLMVGFEKLVYEQKKLLYGICLLLSAVNNLQLLLYTSVFLVVYFLSLEFENIKEFVGKLLRVDFVSFLSLLPSVYVVYAVVYSTNDSAYRDADASFPLPGFHKSFFDQWKSYLFLSRTQTINADDGGLNVYFGLLLLILAGVFLLSQKYPVKKKLRTLIPVLFLTLAFNGKVLSYLMNGLHYQNNVPNRYAFLMAFLMGRIGYEGLLALGKIGKKRMCTVFVLCLGGVALCYLFGNETYAVSGWASVILFIIYGIWMMRASMGQAGHGMIGGCILLLYTELFIATLYSGKNIEFSEIGFYGDIEAERTAMSSLEEGNPGIGRFSFPYSKILCGGSLYGVPSISLFNSNVTKHQVATASFYGYPGGTNWLMDRSDSSVFSNTIQNVKYICLSKYTMGYPADLTEYAYVGGTERFMIFENKGACSYGLYISEKTKEQLTEAKEPIDGWAILSGDEFNEENGLFDEIVLHFQDDSAGFFYTDVSGEKLSFDKAKEVYEVKSEEDRMCNIPELRMHLAFTPVSGGQAYLCGADITSLGRVTEREHFETEIGYPNALNDFGKEYKVIVMKDDVLDAWTEEMKTQSVNRLSFRNNAFIGETDYANPGYTLFSLAYSKDYKAYIDEQEVPVEDGNDAMIFVKTPAGHHTMELRFVPVGLYKAMLFSLVALVIDIVAVMIFERKRKNA